MSSLSRDTSSAGPEDQYRIWHEMPDWRKIELACELYATVKTLALAGLRDRFPHASPDELKRRLADLLLGPDLAARVYGPLPPGSPLT